MSSVCMYYILFIHSAADGDFHCLANVNSAATKTSFKFLFKFLSSMYIAKPGFVCLTHRETKQTETLESAAEKLLLQGQGEWAACFQKV